MLREHLCKIGVVMETAAIPMNKVDNTLSLLADLNGVSVVVDFYTVYTIVNGVYAPLRP